MVKLKREALLRYTPVALLVLIAYGCRMSGMLGLPETPVLWCFSFVRSLIYLLLVAAWGISVHRRIIQRQVRCYLTAIVCLMLFWLLVRTVKFNFAQDPFLSHWLWYLFYLPNICIPMLTLFVSRVICQSEEYRLPHKFRSLYLLALILLALVLTNDLHNLVFILPQDNPLTTETLSYDYGPGYYAITVWWVLCYLASVIALFVKNRLPNKNYRILIPVGFMALLGLYVVFYWFFPPWFQFLFGDFSVIFCLLLMAFFESLLQLGLMQSNTHYADVFCCAGLSAVIVDEDYRELVSTAAYRPLPLAVMRQAEEAPVVTRDGIRLSSAPIRHGRVLWQENISELQELNERLRSTRLDIAEQNAAEVEAYKADALRRQFAERNRLYDQLQIRNRSKVQRLSELLDALERADAAAEHALLLQISVIGAYIKRRNNLSFISESEKDISPRELYYCIEQSLDCLTLFGIAAEQEFLLTSELPIADMIQLYETFEEAVECSLDTLSELFLSLTEKENEIVMVIRLCTEADLSALTVEGLKALNEGGEWLLSLRVRRGGEALC